MPANHRTHSLMLSIRHLKLVGALILIALIYLGIRDAIKNRCPRKLNYKYPTATNGTKTILLWGKYFGGPFTSFDYAKLTCKHKCESTTDVDMLPVVDAVLFHMWDLDMDSLPAYKTKCQKWVVLNQEPPSRVLEEDPISLSDLSEFGKHVDWTSTHRRDSDIWLPYGQFRAANSSSKERKVQKVEFEAKSKDIAWFVTRCHTSSRRENYVEEFAKYIDVDIYGKCGPHKCKKSDGAKCLEMLERDYKFYLSFENSICRDYVTEKLFKILDYNVIPVVRGGADYKSLMPPNSYIDVSDFDSPEQVAMYLKKVSSDKKLYESFFTWKSTYEVFYANEACKVCEALHTDLEGKTNRDLAVWFTDEDTRCLRNVSFQ